MKNTKKITYTVEKVIETLPIVENIVAYKVQTLVDGNIISEGEGISTVEAIQELEGNAEIKSFKVQTDVEKRSISLSLFDKLVIEFLRNNPLSYHENGNKVFDFEIANPYSYIQENGIEDITLLGVDYGNHAAYDYKGERVPVAVYIDYLSGHLDNYDYDLEVALEILKNRDDVSFVKGIAEIQRIPYYNADEDRNQHIAIFWQPKDEDFSRILPKLNNCFTRYKTILHEVIGLERKEIIETDED